MDHKETLKSMITNFINGDNEAATEKLSAYFVAKSKEITGMGSKSTEKRSEIEEIEIETDPEKE